MISSISLVVFGLLLVIITVFVQSAPIEPIKKSIPSPKRTHLKSVDPVTPPKAVSSDLIAYKINDIKKKRNIDDYHWFDDFLDDDNKIKNKLHTNIKETPAKIHDNVDKSVDTDNSNVFTDIKMNPKELINLARKRRNINLNDGSNQRHKRAVSTYDFYNTDPFYESLIEQPQFVRPSRSFAPIYWYPALYKRNIRSALASSYYDRPEWSRIYANTIENDDNDEDQDLFYNNDDDDEDEYEYNRYPILLDSSNIPYDNLQSQQKYNIDDLPFDDDDDQDERFFFYSL